MILIAMFSWLGLGTVAGILWGKMASQADKLERPQDDWWMK